MGTSWVLTPVQHIAYMPSGAVLANSDGDVQQRMFCGKELQPLHGWKMYDSHARMQYNVLPRFSATDPLCQKYYQLSPYAYCTNDPVLEAYDENGERFALPALYVEEYDTEKCEVRYGEGCWLKGIASTNGFLFNNRFEVEGMGSALLLSFLADGLGNMSPVLTGIESCTVNKTVNPGLVYDYHGRRVGEDSRGIVIENGRKVLK